MANLQAVPLPRFVLPPMYGDEEASRAEQLVIEPTPELAVVLDELPAEPVDHPPEMAGMYYLG